MKVIILTTTLVIGNPKKYFEDDSAKRITDEVYYRGCKQTNDPGYKLLDPVISVSNIYGNNPQVEFTYPKKRNLPLSRLEVSDFRILVNDPLKFSFTVTDGINTNEYQITKEMEEDYWSGFISKGGEIVFALSGEIREISSK